jgi:hypothetical protein
MWTGDSEETLNLLLDKFKKGHMSTMPNVDENTNKVSIQCAHYLTHELFLSLH